MFLVAAFFISIAAYHHTATAPFVVPTVPYICYDFCA